MAVKFRDYYETLGLARGATQDEIKSAFRKLARKHHPDVAKDKKAGEEKFKEINEAYEVLSDPEKRRKYDEMGANWQQGQDFRPPQGWDGGAGEWRSEPGAGGDFHFGGTGFSDFFETFFGTRGGVGGFGGGRGEQAFRQRGRDVEADIMVTLEEALHGSKRTITLQRAGAQAKPELETYQVKIPPGVREGQRIRLAGQGEGGSSGGESGDLFLRVRFARHPDFRVQGADLFYDLQVAPWEAVLGCSIQIPSLAGNATLKVPPGTSSGRKMRLKHLGLPDRGGTRGDLFVVVMIEAPDSLSAREKELWEELRQISKFDPRR